MRRFTAVALIALFFPLVTGSQDGGDLINAVIGNATTPSLPAGADETLRIQTHLFSVVERLSMSEASNQSLELRRARARNILRLVQYATAGRFPQKPAGIPGRIPNFMSEDGAVCAVGYLVEQDLGIDVVKEIAHDHQFDYLPYIDAPALTTWQQRSGLTVVELAMIQPTYDHWGENRLEVSIERTMAKLVKEGFTGQMVVARGNRPIVESSYGYLEPGVRVDQATGYDIASVTKAFTAAAIYRLILDDRLHFKDMLGGLLADAPEDKGNITIEQLLGHTSGLGTTYAADGETDRTRALAKLLAQPLASEPGSTFEYSDDGYIVLAAIIEIVSKTAYEEFVERYILNPNQMHNTTFWGDDSRSIAGFSRPLDSALTKAHWGQRGSGGIISTADDLYWWTATFLSGHVVRAQEELIKPRTQVGDGISAGYGWFRSQTRNGDEILWTRGNEDFGHNAMIAIYYATSTVLVVTSNRFIGEEPWSRRVKSALEPILAHR